MNQINIFRVFIASPGDVQDERIALRELVEEINGVFSKETNWRIELLGWEDTMPAIGRPQELINADLDKADLFIGCLWQRWGSYTGNGNKTGFEEEFDRALARRAETNLPDMWMFFKEVEPIRKNDPGEQLQKVLDFRQREINSKRLLFREFDTCSEWKKMLHDLLFRHLLRLVTVQSGSGAGVQSGSTSQNNAISSQEVQASEAIKESFNASIAVQSLSATLETARDRVSNGKLSVFSKSDALDATMAIRILVFAASNYDWHWQHIQMGAHEINSAYVNRQELDLTDVERLFLIRSVLLDQTLTKPGWFWLHNWETFEHEGFFVWFTAVDSESSTRRSTIDLLTRAGFKLTKIKKAHQLMEMLCGDSDASVKIAFLNHLSELGGRAELHLANRLLQDDDKHVRKAAECCVRLIKLRTERDVELRRLIKSGDTVEFREVAIVREISAKLTEDTLAMAVTCKSEALRALSSSELLLRDKIDSSMARQLCQDEARLVRENGWMALVRLDEPIVLNEVRISIKGADYYMSPYAPFWNKGDANRVLAEYFERMSLERLWEIAKLMDENSVPAIEAMGKHHYAETVETLRADLLSDFKGWAEPTTQSQASRFIHTMFLDHAAKKRRDVKVAVLNVLASRPRKDTRSIFLSMLSTDYADMPQTLACLRGLAHVGNIDDREKILTLLSSGAAVQAEATKTYLALSETKVSAIKDIIANVSPTKLQVVIRSAMDYGDKSLFPLLEHLLLNEDERIRRQVCYYAVWALSKKKLQSLLMSYQKGARLFYNVMVILDRSLFAPPVLQATFKKDEEDFFSKIIE